MINTLRPDFFPVNIKGAIKRRAELAVLKNKQYMEVSKEMLDLIQNSELVSKSKSSYLLSSPVQPSVLVLTLFIGSRGRALGMLNAKSKKRKRPDMEGRERPQLTMGLHQRP